MCSEAHVTQLTTAGQNNDTRGKEWKNWSFDDQFCRGVLQKNLKTITRREHKHPRIEAYAVMLLRASQFVASGGVDIHVPDRYTSDFTLSA